MITVKSIPSTGYHPGSRAHCPLWPAREDVQLDWNICQHVTLYLNALWYIIMPLLTFLGFIKFSYFTGFIKVCSMESLVAMVMMVIIIMIAGKLNHNPYYFIYQTQPCMFRNLKVNCMATQTYHACCMYCCCSLHCHRQYTSGVHDRLDSPPSLLNVLLGWTMQGLLRYLWGKSKVNQCMRLALLTPKWACNLLCAFEIEVISIQIWVLYQLDNWRAEK